MSTPQTAQVFITNNTDGTAKIQLWHNNSDYGTESGTWTAAPGQTVGPLTVHFNTGWGSFTVLEYWGCESVVTGGSTPGRLESTGMLQYSSWKECQLQGADKIAEHLQAKLGIGFGETTADGRYTLKEGECMGVCGDAPAIIVNNTRLCSWMTRERIDALLDELK